MANDSIKLKPDQPRLRYLGLDVTEAIDTVVFGHLWNRFFGWDNLLWQLDLNPADATKQTRLDKAHPKLPIKRLTRTFSGDTFADNVLMPIGVDANGPTATLPEADINSFTKFMQTFIVSPGAEKASSSLNDTGTGVAPNVMYISTHSFHTAEMFGEVIASGPFQHFPFFFFNLGTAAVASQFAGLQWLILSSCGSLDSPTHGDWMSMMGGPNPLRGVVGFQQTCPTARGSVGFVKKFIDLLSKKKTVLEAWSGAVTSKVSADAWLVLCHDEAKDDTIADWNAGKLKPIAAGSPVLLFDNTHTGTALTAPTDPFEAFWSKGGTRITLANRNDPANGFTTGDTVTITIKPRAVLGTFSDKDKIDVTLIYIRPDYPQNVDVTKMFDVSGQTGIAAPTTANLNAQSPGGDDSYHLVVSGTPTEVTLSLKAKDLTMLKHTRMLFWLQVTIPGSAAANFLRNGGILLG